MRVNCAHTEIVDVDLLVPHPMNANKHGDRQIDLLAKIMKHQGWRHPITVSKRSGFIVAGHGRLMAAKKIGWTHAPVDRQDFENEADEYAHLIADNKIAELAEHDDLKMVEDLKTLNIEDFNFDLLGIPDFNIMNVLGVNDLQQIESEKAQEKKFKIEITFPNDMEMMDIHDDLVSRGYLVKIL